MPLVYILATSLMILIYKVIKAIRGVPRGSVSLGSGKVYILGGGGHIGEVI
jgi:hypothetical protein